MEPHKILLLVRHAKSSWDIGTASDFERTLNERGKKDAPIMANRLLEKKIKLDALVASPAKRAKKTAELFCEELKLSKADIIFLPELYHANTDVFFKVVEHLNDHFQSVAIFSHNPGITEFVNLLVPNTYLDNMPTCGIFAVSVHTNKWTDFKTAKKELLFFDYPKS